MEFQVLGDVTAHHNGEELNLGRRQERILLGLLLLEAGRVVSADHLLDRLWQGAPPATGRRTLHTYVARLRSRLAPFQVRIETRGAGYAIDVNPEQWTSLVSWPLWRRLGRLPARQPGRRR